MNQLELHTLLQKDFPNLDNDKLNKLDLYYQLLIEANQKFNLTSITNEEDIYIKHFYDSLLLSKTIDLNSRMSLLDIGTGAGFPGIVLKIVFPKLEITLLEATQKKCIFLEEVINKLDLHDIYVVNDRAEIYINDHRESFDIVTSRAVAALNILLELSSSYVKIGGYFLPLKGTSYQEELANSYNAAKTLKMELEDIKEFNLPLDKGTRYILKYSKMNKTNPIYPRSYQKISNKPL